MGLKQRAGFLQSELDRHLVRCLSDRQYFFASHLQVVNEQSRLVSFGTLFPAQKKIQDRIDEDLKEGRPTRLIILKARRHRISTLMAANIFHACIFNEHRRGYIVAHDRDTTSTLFQMHKNFYDHLDDLVRPMKRFSNAKELLFENPDDGTRKSNPGLGSSITVRVASSGGKKVGVNQGAAGVGRGDRIDLLHASEVAFWPRGAETFTGFSQAVPDEPGTMVAMESTANGAAGFFWSEWQRAVSGDSGYTPIFVPWFDHPNYRASVIAINRDEWLPSEDDIKYCEEFYDASLAMQNSRAEKIADRLKLDQHEQMLINKYRCDWDQIMWRRYCIKFKARSPEIFDVEYPCNADVAFASSGLPRFNNDKLRTMVDMCVQPSVGHLVSDKKDWEWQLNSWEAPNFSFANRANGWLHVIDMPKKGNCYVVGADAGHGVGQDASALAVFDRTEQRFVAHACDNMMKADLLAERLVKVGHFYNTAYLAPEFNGPGILTAHLIVQSGYPKMYYSQRLNVATQRYTDSPGFVTDQKSRNLLIDKFDIGLENSAFELPIRAVIDEAMTFVLDIERKRADHLAGAHDDLLFAAMIAYFVHGQVMMDTVLLETERTISWNLRPPVVPDDLKDDDDALDMELMFM